MRNTYGKLAVQQYKTAVCMTEVRRGDTMKRVGSPCYSSSEDLTIICMGSEQEHFDLGVWTYQDKGEHDIMRAL